MIFEVSRLVQLVITKLLHRLVLVGEKVRIMMIDMMMVFEELMQTVKSNSLGQISSALYHVGGEYRRNM